MVDTIGRFSAVSSQARRQWHGSGYLAYITWGNAGFRVDEQKGMACSMSRSLSLSRLSLLILGPLLCHATQEETRALREMSR